MATTVRTRRNHYDTLGLSPRATNSEIAEAFGREILLSRTRAFGSVAEVSIAYETLRDPAKRKAYDQSIGVNRPPPVVCAPTAVSFRSSAHFIAGPPEPRADPVPPAEQAEVEPQQEPRTSSFIAAALRTPTVEPALEERRAPIDRAAAPTDIEVEEQGFGWRRPAAAGAVVIAAVALLGAWAGIEAGNDAESAQAAVTVAVPSAKAKPPASAATAADAPPPTIALAPPPPARPRAAARIAPRVASKPVEEVDIHRQAPNGPFEEIAASQAIEAAPSLTDAPVETAPASLPLSKAAIAQAIGRIGYRCGQVASTSQILGNVFKVTCTSGDSYRAAPVHGRYRFKRLGSH